VLICKRKKVSPPLSRDPLIVTIKFCEKAFGIILALKLIAKLAKTKLTKITAVLLLLFLVFILALLLYILL
jgi:hypothetical protein